MNLFDYSNIGQISDLVKDHFPQFFKEDGPVFIEFLQAYYEWMQEPDNPIGQSRDRYKQFDIDTASSIFLEHYRKKYMWGLPPELLGNQRLLQKHILELYRSKGSQQAIRLLFRLLFNQDIEFYIPSYDIFKLSDNNWIEPKYIEITATELIDRYHGKVVTGSTSRATAIVENYQSRIVNGQHSYLLFVSNIIGEFKPGEAVLTEGINPLNAPIIKGSVVGYDILTSSPGIYVGDTLTATLGEVPVELVVSETFEGSGSLDFTIERPGTYYSMDAVFHEQKAIYQDYFEPIIHMPISSPAYGFKRDPSANLYSVIRDSIYVQGLDNIVPDFVPVSGGGAEIRIKSIKDTFVYEYNLDKVRDFLTVSLDGLYPFPKLPTSNTDTIVADSLGMNSIVVGSIESIQIINPGFNYSANSWFFPIDPHTSNSGIQDANGMNVGENGLIIGIPQLGTSIAKEVKILASGYNNIQYDPNSFLHDANTDLMITGSPIVGGVGWARGFYESTKSFISDDKYLFDGHYYQDFSYVIKASTTLDKYVDILKQIVHPAGNAVYGDIRIIKKNSLDHYAQEVRIKQTIRTGDGFSLDFLTNTYNSIEDKHLVPVGPIENYVSFARQSEGTYMAVDSRYKSAEEDQIRFTHDPQTTLPLGAMLEESANEILVNTVDFKPTGNPTWINPTNYFAAINPKTSVFEGQTAWEHVAMGQPSRSRYYSLTTPLDDGNTYVCSTIAENIDGNLFEFGIYNTLTVTWVARVRYNWNTGAMLITSGIPTDMRAINMGVGPNGGKLVRLSFKFSPTDPDAGDRRFYIYPSGTPADDAGTSTILHHASLQHAVTLTSPTVSINSAFNRAADLMSIAKGSRGEGTVVVRGRTPVYTNNTSFVWQWIDSNVGRVFLFIDGANSTLTAGVDLSLSGGPSYTRPLGVVAPNTNFVAGVTFKDNQLAGSLNGAAAVVNSSPFSITALNQLHVGHQNELFHWNGTIADLYVIDKAVTLSELRSL